MVLGKLPVPGRPTLWMIVGQGPIALAVGAGRGGLDIFTLLYLISSLSPSLWETARYRLKYCLKGPLNPKQPTNQPGPDKSARTHIHLSNIVTTMSRFTASVLNKNKHTHNFLKFLFAFLVAFSNRVGWSGGAMVLGKLPVPGRPTIWIQ